MWSNPLHYLFPKATGGLALECRAACCTYGRKGMRSFEVCLRKSRSNIAPPRIAIEMIVGISPLGQTSTEQSSRKEKWSSKNLATSCSTKTCFQIDTTIFNLYRSTFEAFSKICPLHACEIFHRPIICLSVLDHGWSCSCCCHSGFWQLHNRTRYLEVTKLKSCSSKRPARPKVKKSITMHFSNPYRSSDPLHWT